MPAHPKTTDAQIIQAARRLVESQGRDGFSMNEVAASVGIRAPSLYGRFKDRAGLLAAVELELYAEVTAVLASAIVVDAPEATLMAQAQAMRRFAREHPNSYSLFFDIRSVPTDEGTAARAALAAQLIAPLTMLVGKDHAFAAARVLVPFVHGFISMELANAFRLGGSLDAAFENGVYTIVRGVVRLTGVDSED
jgi:AcrR family transcriptional regulator